MATVYVTEFVSQGVDLNGRQLPVAALPILAQQTVATATTSASSASFQGNTQLVRIHSDTVCSVNIAPFTGTGVLTATTTNFRMAANQTEYFNVPGNGLFKVAVIANT